MPKLFKYLGVLVFFYSNEHEPVHVHGRFQGCENKAVFHIENGEIRRIEILPVRGKRPLPPAKRKAFETVVNAFADTIVKSWVDYFVYHRPLKCIEIEGNIR